METYTNEKAVKYKFGFELETTWQFVSAINELQLNINKKKNVEVTAASDGLGQQIISIELTDDEFEQLSDLMSDRYSKKFVYLRKNWFIIENE